MYQFCTTNDVKVRTNTPEAYTDDDDMITAAIDDATSLIRLFSRRSWDHGVYVDTISSITIDACIRRGVLLHTLSEGPRDTEAPFSIRLSGAGNFAEATPLPDDGYQFDARTNQITIYTSRMVAAPRSIRIEYTGGYKLSEDPLTPLLLLVPHNVRAACAAQAAFSYMRQKNRTVGTSMKQDKVGLAMFKTTASGLCSEALALLRGTNTPMVGKG